MLIIAHRGASLQCPENTITAFHYAADNEADIIEMDIRRTVDGHFVIFHDATLERVDGTNTRIDTLTYTELATRLDAAHWPQPLTVEMLAHEYKRATPLLFHIKIEGSEPELATRLDELPVSFYLGVVALPAVTYFSRRYGRERVLAFMPGKQDGERFIERGAGIIRLWEQWLDREALQSGVEEPLISQYKPAGARVWIMTNGPEGVGMTDTATLSLLTTGGVDGVLLNDVHLGGSWKSRQDTL